MTTTGRYPYEAGIWEQYLAETGDGLSVRSRHATRAAAVRAAVRLSKGLTSTTGGALSWSGGVRGPDGRVTWYQSDGRTWRQANQMEVAP
jgi:hypothetical protein